MKNNWRIVVNAKEIAERLEFDMVGVDFDITDVEVQDTGNPDEVAILVCADNAHLDNLTYTVVIKDVDFTPGPPMKEDYEPDRLEPGDEF